MPRATGPIGYIEHRSPRKDENGKYIIHPQFVQKEMYDAEKMAHDSQGRCMTNGAQFVSVMDTIETLTLQALGRGDAVRIGDTPYSSVGVAAGVSRAADSRGTSGVGCSFHGSGTPFGCTFPTALVVRRYPL